MLKKFLGTAALVAVMVAPAMAQGGMGGMGRGQRGPRDHWMTVDSLVAAVGAADSQKAGIKMHLDALNAVMKKLSDDRMAMMQSLNGERPSDDQRAKMMEAGQAAQKEIDGHYDELRKLLSADQQAKFDALPKPRVGGGRRGGGGSGGN